MDRFTVEGVRDGIVALDVLREILGVQPDMIDAWMELSVLIHDAIDEHSLAAVREQIDDAMAELLSGAEQIRSLAHRYRNM